MNDRQERAALGREEAPAEIRQAAKALRQMYVALRQPFAVLGVVACDVDAGDQEHFSEQQALNIIAVIMASNANGGDES